MRKRYLAAQEPVLLRPMPGRPSIRAALHRTLGPLTATTAAAGIVAMVLVAAGLFLAADNARTEELAEVQAEATAARVHSEVLMVAKGLDLFLQNADLVLEQSAVEGLPLSWMTDATLETVGVSHVVLFDAGGRLQASAGLPLPIASTAAAAAAGTLAPLPPPPPGTLAVSSLRQGPLPWLRQVQAARSIYREGERVGLLVAAVPVGVLAAAVENGTDERVLRGMNASTRLTNVAGDVLVTHANGFAADGLGAGWIDLRGVIDGLYAAFAGHPPAAWHEVSVADTRYGLTVVKRIDLIALHLGWLREALPLMALILGMSAVIVWAGRRIDRHAADAMFRAVVDSSSNGLCEIDEDGIIRYVNPRIRSLIAGPAAGEADGAGDPVGRPLHTLFIREDQEAVRRMTPGRASTEPVTARIRGHDGRLVEMDIGAAPLTLKHYRGVVLSLTDVTAREEARRAREAALEMAEAASREKNRFLAAASHDLRQPMQVILLTTRRLQRATELSARSREMVEDVRHAAGVMADLIHDLLDFSRLTAGTVPASIAPTDIARVAGDVVRDARAGCDKPLTITLTVETGPAGGGPYVLTDGALMRRVLQNLVSNAVKYTDEGGVSVSVAGRGDAVTVAVADTGKGIAPQHLENIFKEFYQVDNEGRDFTQGFGLGLAICKHVLTLLGHDISVASEPGRGSCFTITLPGAEAPAARLSVTAASA